MSKASMQYAHEQSDDDVTEEVTVPTFQLAARFEPYPEDERTMRSRPSVVLSRHQLAIVCAMFASAGILVGALLGALL